MTQAGLYPRFIAHDGRDSRLKRRLRAGRLRLGSETFRPTVTIHLVYLCLPTVELAVARVAEQWVPLNHLVRGREFTSVSSSILTSVARS
jgi:hypothetical protein